MGRLAGGQGLFHVFPGYGLQAQQKSEDIQVVRPVLLAGKLVQRKQGRRLEQLRRVLANRSDLLTAGKDIAFHFTAMAAQRNIVTVRIGERHGSLDLERDSLLAERTAKGQFHRHICHSLTQLGEG